MTTEKRILRNVALFLIATGLIFFVALCYGGTIATQVSPDHLWRVEIADNDSRLKFELYSTPLGTGVRRKISGTTITDYDVADFLISPDSTRVVFRKGRTATGDWQLYSTPINVGVPVRLSTGMAYVEELRFDGYRVPGPDVHFRATVVAGGPLAWSVAPMTGGMVRPLLVFADGFEGGTTGGWR